MKTRGGLVGALAITATLAAANLASAAETGYSSVPDPLPGDLPGITYGSSSVAALGDHIAFADGATRLDSATVVMTSQACQRGVWFSNCMTTPGATFDHDITLDVYAVDDAGGQPAPGTLLATVTETVAVPYRPSSSPDCTLGGWLDGDTCRRGVAFPVTFPVSLAPVPDEIIWSVAFDTQRGGAHPIGVAGPYDSLGLALGEVGPSVGTDVDPDAIFLDANQWGRAPGLSIDVGWQPYVPMARFEVSAEPTVDDCKNGGWKAYGFRNQGQCVASVQAAEPSGGQASTHARTKLA